MPGPSRDAPDFGGTKVPFKERWPTPQEEAVRARKKQPGSTESPEREGIGQGVPDASGCATAGNKNVKEKPRGSFGTCRLAQKAALCWIPKIVTGHPGDEHPSESARDAGIVIFTILVVLILKAVIRKVAALQRQRKDRFTHNGPAKQIVGKSAMTRIACTRAPDLIALLGTSSKAREWRPGGDRQRPGEERMPRCHEEVECLRADGLPARAGLVSSDVGASAWTAAARERVPIAAVQRFTPKRKKSVSMACLIVVTVIVSGLIDLT